MLDKNKQETAKELLNEAISLLQERKDVLNEMKEVLKKDEDYQKILESKKEIDLIEKEQKHKTIGAISIEKEDIDNSLRGIKESLSDILDINKATSNKLIQFFKKKYESGQDELSEITSAWIQIGLDNVEN